MALMIVREVSNEGEREFELQREQLARIVNLTKLDESVIYTILSSGKPLEDGHYTWVMLRQ